MDMLFLHQQDHSFMYGYVLKGLILLIVVYRGQMFRTPDLTGLGWPVLP